jgi:hypothetical protein
VQIFAFKKSQRKPDVVPTKLRSKGRGTFTFFTVDFNPKIERSQASFDPTFLLDNSFNPNRHLRVVKEGMIMVQWTVLLKTPAGLEYYTVEADVADWDEHGRLTFNTVEPTPELMDALRQLMQSELTTEQRNQEFMKLVRSLGRMTSASFQSDLVGGFFNTEHAKLLFKVQDNNKE